MAKQTNVKGSLRVYLHSCESKHQSTQRQLHRDNRVIIKHDSSHLLLTNKIQRGNIKSDNALINVILDERPCAFDTGFPLPSPH